MRSVPATGFGDRRHPMTSRPLFSQHRSMAMFLPHARQFLIKGLAEFETKQNGGKFSATDQERYTARVMERVDALDSCVQSLRLAMCFILDLNKDATDAMAVYRYHYENFLLRLTGVVDRAHRLVGVSLELDAGKLNSIGSNPFVMKAVMTDHPALHGALKGLSDAVAAHKDARNAVAHSEAYSSRVLSTIAAATMVEQDLDLGGIDLKELAKHHFAEGGASLARLIAEMVSGVEALLDALEPIFVAKLGDATHGSV